MINLNKAAKECYDIAVKRCNAGHNVPNPDDTLGLLKGCAVEHFGNKGYRKNHKRNEKQIRILPRKLYKEHCSGKRCAKRTADEGTHSQKYDCGEQFFIHAHINEEFGAYCRKRRTYRKSGDKYTAGNTAVGNEKHHQQADRKKRNQKPNGLVVFHNVLDGMVSAIQSVAKNERQYSGDNENRNKLYGRGDKARKTVGESCKKRDRRIEKSDRNGNQHAEQKQVSYM